MNAMMKSFKSNMHNIFKVTINYKIPNYILIVIYCLNMQFCKILN